MLAVLGLAGCVSGESPGNESEERSAVSASSSALDDDAACVYGYDGTYTSDGIYWYSTCLTLSGTVTEHHFTSWARPSQAEINRDCIGACGAGCTTTSNLPGVPPSCEEQFRTGGEYRDGDLFCRNTDRVMHCYTTDCCYYHDLCGRSGFSLFGPVCTEFADALGCKACIGPGHLGCSDGLPNFVDFPQDTTRSCRPCSPVCPRGGGTNDSRAYCPPPDPC